MATPNRKVFRAQENVSIQTNELVPALKVTPEGTSSKKSTPPKPPRSAFICFTDAKKTEIISQYGVNKESAELLKLVAKEWRHISKTDRAYWDEVSRNDKLRFIQEKAEYKGPWTVPKRRAKKHPLAPKRPMSAFLKFSQKRRSTVKAENPDVTNTDVSRILGEMWRNARASETEPYKTEEEKERAVYKKEIQKFKEEQAKKDAASRTSHKSVQKMAEYRPHPPPLRSTREVTSRPPYESEPMSRHRYEMNSNNFESSRRHETVENVAGRGDQRMMFRHNFGAPFSPYPPGPPPPPPPPLHHQYETMHHPAPYPSEYHNPISDPHMPAIHRSFATLQLDDEDDLMYPGNHTNYFSDSMGFNFYNSSNNSGSGSGYL